MLIRGPRPERKAESPGYVTYSVTGLGCISKGTTQPNPPTKFLGETQTAGSVRVTYSGLKDFSPLSLKEF